MHFCKYDDVKQHISDEIFKYIKNPKTFIVKLFPYYCGEHYGNIAKYARGMDYHVVVPRKLDEIIIDFKEKYPQAEFAKFCDNSPLPEVLIAYKSGAGILGKNRLIFDENYGGYVFIGIIATDAEIEFDKPDLRECVNCGACIKACPTGSILSDEIRESTCLSHLTQMNSDVLDESVIKKSKYIWGCDICLDVCPMNRQIFHTDILEFKENLIYEITTDDVREKTRKEFANQHPDRAYTFRGPKPLLRNLTIKQGEK